MNKNGKSRLRHIIIGNTGHMGLLKGVVLYTLLIGIGFIYLYPMLYMFVNSLMSPEDLTDPTVTWLPTQLYFDNFVKAFNTLDFLKSFWNSVYITVISTLLQTSSVAVTAYALARFELPVKKLWIALILLTFIVPVETMLVPRYVLLNNYGLLDTPLAFWLNAVFGQGLKSAVFILVFFQIFRSYPISIDEAAEIDGAGRYKIFGVIALPIARSGIVLSILFSFVWYWNETRQSGLYFGSVIKTLPMKLGSFAASYSSLYEDSAGVENTARSINESITLAGTLLSVLPIIIMYVILQNQFVESIEKSGITGE